MDTETTTEKLTTEERRLDRLNLIRERAAARKNNPRLTKGGAAILETLRANDEEEEIGGAGKDALAGLLALEEEAEREEVQQEDQRGLDAEDESVENTKVVSPLMLGALE